MRNRIIIGVIVILLFLYWHGIKKVTDAKGWDCNYQIVYSVCSAKNNKAQLPSLWDVLKAGATF
jgi:hypothetical protein